MIKKATWNFINPVKYHSIHIWSIDGQQKKLNLKNLPQGQKKPNLPCTFFSTRYTSSIQGKNFCSLFFPPQYFLFVSGVNKPQHKNSLWQWFLTVEVYFILKDSLFHYEPHGKWKRVRTRGENTASSYISHQLHIHIKPSDWGPTSCNLPDFFLMGKKNTVLSK